MFLSYFIILISIIFIGIYIIYRIKYPKKYYLIYTVMAIDNEGRTITQWFKYSSKNYYPSFSELEIIVKNTKDCEDWTDIAVTNYTPLTEKQFKIVF